MIQNKNKSFKLISDKIAWWGGTRFNLSKFICLFFFASFFEKDLFEDKKENHVNEMTTR